MLGTTRSRVVSTLLTLIFVGSFMSYFIEETSTTSEDAPNIVTRGQFGIKRRIHGSKKKRLPDAIIIGVKKGGTATSRDFLTMNPFVRAGTKELHFFNVDKYYKKGLKYYRSLMPTSREGQITLEKTPAYFCSQLSPERIYKMNPKIKLILVVKDPIDRAISDYVHWRSNNRKLEKNNKFYEIAIDAKTGKVNDTYRPIFTGRYAVYLKSWYEYFNKSQIHIVDGDRLVEDPVTEVNKMENFLEIPSTITKNNFVMSKSKGFYCMKTGGSKTCMSASKGRKHPFVPKSVKDKLKLYYQPYNEQFCALTGLKFKWCNYLED